MSLSSRIIPRRSSGDSEIRAMSVEGQIHFAPLRWSSPKTSVDITNNILYQLPGFDVELLTRFTDILCKLFGSL